MELIHGRMVGPMPDNKNVGENLMTIMDVAQMTGVRQDILEYHIESGAMGFHCGLVSAADCARIMEQKESLTGLRKFLKQYDNGRFESRYVKHRDKYIDFLEHNDYFGIQIHEPEAVLFEIPKNEEFYVSNEDALFLGFKSEGFFREYGLTEEEKINKIIRQNKGHPVARKHIRNYLMSICDRENLYTPSVTDFVKIIFHLPEVKELSDEDVVLAIEDAGTAKTKELLVGFLSYVSMHEEVRYHSIKLKKKDYYGKPAYPYEDYVGLARILFNEDYGREHRLTEKALGNHLYAEAWLFLSCHYVCGWRSSDICSRWVYPCLKADDNPFRIRTDTLREDILNGDIPEGTYESVALYAIRKIDLANNVPQKTGHGKLRSEIVPDLRKFFGKLILIAECHHIDSGEGYMAAQRTAYYRNWAVCRDFFGEDFVKIFGKRPVLSQRLNKSYLQGIEQAARENGNTALAAHVIAAFARNHAGINTTAIYLRDHGLTGESADVVLYMMMQRGVFSVSLYAALLAAFPGAFEKLTAKEQTQIMEKIPLSAYELEMAGAPLLASDRMGELFAGGRADEAAEILKAMFSLAQGRGKAKDAGIWCMQKALGFNCEHPTYASCIANLCPYLIFTNEGVLSLVNVVKEYRRKELATGNGKYGTALKKHIIPAFQEVINAVLAGMSSHEKAGMRKLLGEAFNE